MNNDQGIAWYKQFWPWFVFGLPALAVVAGVVTIYIAVKYADSLVVDDYYKEGLAINSSLQREQLAKSLGLQFSLTINRETTSLIGVLHAPESYRHPSTLLLKLIHPLNAHKDLSFPLQATAVKGEYQQQFYEIENADWDVELTPILLGDQQTSNNQWKIQSKLSELPRFDVEK